MQDAIGSIRVRVRVRVRAAARVKIRVRFVLCPQYAYVKG